METFYSSCQNLTVDCYLFTTPQLSTTVPAGFYSNGIHCFETDYTGKIIEITPCVIPCDLELGDVTSTPPTTIGGTDGTITAIFSTPNGPTTYTINGGPSLPAVSPLVITGLSSGVEYTILITDSTSCTKAIVMTLGQSATLFDADWIHITYEFQDGVDLDTRTRMYSPNIGQDTQPKYLGWYLKGSADLVNPQLSFNLWNEGGAIATDYVMLFGGDNTGIGFESILINVQRFKAQFPGVNEFIIDLRAFWYNTLGVLPVNAAVTLWKGGLPAHDGCFQAGHPYCWTNPGATDTKLIDSVPKTINLWFPTVPEKQTTLGERVAILKYNILTTITILDNNISDGTIPPL